MPGRVFTATVLLFSFVWMFCGCNVAHADEKVASSCGGSSNSASVWRDITDADGTVSALRVPGLVAVEGDVFAVAEAQCKKNNDASTFTGISSELLALSAGGTTPTEKPLIGANLKTEVLMACDPVSKPIMHVFRPTTIVSGEHIFMLVANYGAPPSSVKNGATAADVHGWSLLLVTGNVSNVEKGGKRIEWGENYGLGGMLSTGAGHNSLRRLVGGGGSGIVTGGTTLVFPVKAKKKASASDDSGKTVSLIMYLRNGDKLPKGTAAWMLSKGMSDEGCGSPSVVEWKDGKLLMMTACEDGYRRVYETSNMGETWTEAVGTLSGVWGNSRGRKGNGVQGGFTTATVEDRKVMLLTLPLYPKGTVDPPTENKKGHLHLWVTDNTHIVDVGSISAEDDDVAASSLLYKSGGSGTASGNTEELIALYDKKTPNKDPSLGLFSMRLTAQLGRVKEIVRTWKEVDSRVSETCSPSSGVRVCRTPMPTDGLVGYLSGGYSENTWRDEYLGVNATVSPADGAKTNGNGLTFKGPASWAEWPVGAQGQNQLYRFANTAFTLVATVTIHKVPKKGSSTPLMGVRGKNNKNKPTPLGVSYTHDGKWETTFNGEKAKKDGITWEPGREYQVAIVWQGGNKGSVYINGQPLGEPTTISATGVDLQEISYFYIGGYRSDKGGIESEDKRVTVTDVFLYNRAWTTNEFKKYGADKVTVPETPPQEPPGPPPPPSHPQREGVPRVHVEGDDDVVALSVDINVKVTVPSMSCCS